MRLAFLFMLLQFPGFYNSFAQVRFVERMEVETTWEDDDFIVLQKQQGLVAFRMVAETGFSRNRKLEYFATDLQLNSKQVKHIPVKDFYNLLGFDLDGSLLYILFQKGESYASDNYMLKISLLTDEVEEIPLTAVLNMDMQEFFVLNGTAIMMGNMDYRPVIQVFDISTQHLATVQGIYEKDLQIIQMRKAPEFDGFDVLMSRRDRYKNKNLSILSFDTEGHPLREIKIDHLADPDAEIVDGLLAPADSYSQALIGPFRLKRKSVSQGLYFTQINEFGEHESHLYTLEDFSNFFNYLPEKTRNKRLKSLSKSLDKGKKPPIRNTLAVREIIFKDGLYLVYNDYFVSSSRHYQPRNGMYVNNFYRASPRAGNLGGLGDYYSPLWTNPYLHTRQVSYEYKFLSAQMILIDEDGGIVWENSLSLDNSSRFNPGKFGELTFDGQDLFYMYLDGEELKLSLLEQGEKVFENETFALKLLDENQRIRETQQKSLNLLWWYDNYYLLTGKQKVRFQQEDGREGNKEVYFLTKVLVGD